MDLSGVAVGISIGLFAAVSGGQSYLAGGGVRQRPRASCLHPRGPTYWEFHRFLRFIGFLLLVTGAASKPSVSLPHQDNTHTEGPVIPGVMI